MEQWKEALQSMMAQAGDKRQAALRLLNNLPFKSEADQEQCLKDFQLIVGEAFT